MPCPSKDVVGRAAFGQERTLGKADTILAACAPLEWSRKSNVMSAAAPAVVGH